MADETLDSLSKEERAVVEQFREQMSQPGPNKTVSVVNESLGRLMDGTKIQFQPGEGKEFSPALPKHMRWAARERRRLEAAEAAKLRNAKNRKNTLQEVAAASASLTGRNVSESIQLIEMQSPHYRNFFLLAEEEGANRSTVFKAFPPVEQKVRDKYEAERAVVEEINSEDPVEPLIPAN